MKVGGYTLYVGENCSSCEKVASFLREQNIKIHTINIDKEDYDLPFSLMIIPALIKEDKLMGYGPDIIPFLQKITS